MKQFDASVPWRIREAQDGMAIEQGTCYISSYQNAVRIQTGANGTPCLQVVGAGDEDEDIAALRFALYVSIVFIYLLMGFLFESFILPMSIILTIPLSIIGVNWIHFFTGRDMDFLGVVAGILLVGVLASIRGGARDPVPLRSPFD